MKGPKFILELTAGTQGIKGDTGQRGEKGEQGIQGVQGDKGNDGYSPTITEKVNTDREYILTINNKDGSYDTPNLKATNESLGTNGVTFIPSVSEDGIISWTNDGGLENPQSVSIKGPQGPAGKDGRDGIDGEQGPQGEQGLQGPAGPGVAPGGKTKQVLAKNSNNDYDTKWIQIPSQVLDSLDGNSTTEAPSQRAVNEKVGDLEQLEVPYSSVVDAINGASEIVTNDNGTAIKYDNGLMICYGKYDGTSGTLQDYFEQFKRTSEDMKVTFPAQFLEEPRITITPFYKSRVFSVMINSVNTNQFGFTGLKANSIPITNTSVSINYTAIGKWK